MNTRTHRIYRNPNNAYRRLWVATREYREPVLDVGCAEGYMTSAIPCRVTAVDIRTPAEFLAEAEFVEASVYDLPFGDATFGTVCAFELLEHLHRPLNALTEMRRVCAGRLYVTVPAFGQMREVAGHVKDFKDIRAFAVKAGFSVLEYHVQGPHAYLEAE